MINLGNVFITKYIGCETFFNLIYLNSFFISFIYNSCITSKKSYISYRLFIEINYDKKNFYKLVKIRLIFKKGYKKNL